MKSVIYLVRILLVVSLISALGSGKLCAIWIEKGQVTPFAGDLRTRAETEEDAAIFAQYEFTLQDIISCKVKLEEERDRSRRWYRRPGFWVPVACVTFTVGLVAGVGLR